MESCFQDRAFSVSSFSTVEFTWAKGHRLVGTVGQIFPQNIFEWPIAMTSDTNIQVSQTSQVKGTVLHKAALSDIRGDTGLPQAILTSDELATIQSTTPQVR